MKKKFKTKFKKKNLFGNVELNRKFHRIETFWNIKMALLY